jgi:uncharacterized membrane protein
MVAGNSDFQARAGAVAADAKFVLGGISVNQAARSARIRYYIPLGGVDRVEVSTYDIRGRMIWRNTQTVRPASWNTTEWNTRNSRRGGAAAGLYIVRVRAIDARGQTVAVENRRITFAW